MDALTDQSVELAYLESLRTRTSMSIAIRERLLEGRQLNIAAQLARVIVQSFQQGGQTIFFGNGGSSTDAAHLSAEFMGKYMKDRSPLPSHSLADNTAAMTAIGNDFGYEFVFARQLQGIGRPGDVAIGLSTSGNSANVCRGLEAAAQMGMRTVAFTGGDGGFLANIAEFSLIAPAADTADIQECHMLIGHTLCGLVEATLFPDA